MSEHSQKCINTLIKIQHLSKSNSLTDNQLPKTPLIPYKNISNKKVKAHESIFMETSFLLHNNSTRLTHTSCPTIQLTGLLCYSQLYYVQNGCMVTNCFTMSCQSSSHSYLPIFIFIAVTIIYRIRISLSFLSICLAL